MSAETAETHTAHDPITLMQSKRGHYLLAKALDWALRYAESYPTEIAPADIRDITTILKGCFPEFPTTYGMTLEEWAKLEPINQSSIAQADADLMNLVHGRAAENFTLTCTLDNGAYTVIIEDNYSHIEVKGTGATFRDAWFAQSAGWSEGLDRQFHSKVDAKHP